LDVRGDDLSTVLKELAGNVAKMFSIPCAFAVKGAVPPLPGNTTLQIHKIAQEAVSNAIKHGKARRVSIALFKTGHHLVLTIKNDGLPFSPPADARSRMGLRIMNYRANTIGAELEIKALNKNGTVVICSLPVHEGSKLNRRDLVPSAKAVLGIPSPAGLEHKSALGEQTRTE
jgi:signal transduction histidine kinase